MVWSLIARPIITLFVRFLGGYIAVFELRKQLSVCVNDFADAQTNLTHKQTIPCQKIKISIFRQLRMRNTEISEYAHLHVRWTNGLAIVIFHF